MVWCTYCGQEFSRAEHLDRHILTHTNVKPFRCSTCHFSFKRRDLLQRHYMLVHKTLKNPAAEGDTRSRQQLPIACITCHKAKAKCDKAIPTCGRCAAKGLSCEARPGKRMNERRQYSHPRPITMASPSNPSFKHRASQNQYPPEEGMDPRFRSAPDSTYGVSAASSSDDGLSMPSSTPKAASVSTPEQRLTPPQISTSFYAGGGGGDGSVPPLYDTYGPVLGPFDPPFLPPSYTMNPAAGILGSTVYYPSVFSPNPTTYESSYTIPFTATDNNDPIFPTVSAIPSHHFVVGEEQQTHAFEFGARSGDITRPEYGYTGRQRAPNLAAPSNPNLPSASSNAFMRSASGQQIKRNGTW